MGMTASPKMDDDGLTEPMLEAYFEHPNHALNNMNIPTFKALVLLARRAMESRSEVLVPVNIFQGALNYIRHVGANWTERGEPHPQQWIVDGLELAAVSQPSRAEPGAPRRMPDLGPQVTRYSHGNLYHEPADIAKPASAAPEPAAPDRNMEQYVGSPAPDLTAAAPDVKGIAKRLREYRCADPWAGSLMLEAAALLESAHARVDSWPAFTSFYNQGLEEAAKVCEECRVLIIGDPIEQGAVMIARETGHDLARQIRAKIKPARGET